MCITVLSERNKGMGDVYSHKHSGSSHIHLQIHWREPSVVCNVTQVLEEVYFIIKKKTKKKNQYFKSS